jgi:hypothetical protein
VDAAVTPGSSYRVTFPIWQTGSDPLRIVHASGSNLSGINFDVTVMPGTDGSSPTLVTLDFTAGLSSQNYVGFTATGTEGNEIAVDAAAATLVAR